MLCQLRDIESLAIVAYLSLWPLLSDGGERVTSMRSLGGLTLLLAGIGVALLVYLPAPVDSAASRAAHVAAVKFKPVSRLGQFSPSIALSVPTPLGPRLAGLEIAAAAVLQAAVVHETQLGWQTTVASAVTTGPTELTPRDADARNKLAQEIQQQLRRVGCYWGRIDGSWDSVTKDSMREFTHRVNATLPLDLPDYAQLALVQSQSDDVCGACPAGQSLSASKRCVGPITVASPPKEVLPWMANAVPDAPVAVRLFKPVPTVTVPGRMALGAPVPILADVQQDVAPVNSPKYQPLIAALDINVTEVKQQVTAPPKAKLRPGNSYDRNRSHSRNCRFADAVPSQSARKPQHVRAGTPRYNLLLGLGGVY